MKLSVIIPTYNGEHLLKKTIALLAVGLKNIDQCEVIVVDNGSTDETLRMLRKIKNDPFDKTQGHPEQSRMDEKLEIQNCNSTPKDGQAKFKIIFNKNNLGFAKAVNQGAKAGKGEYLLFLNNDCYLEPNTISKMLFFLTKHSKYCATQPVIYKLKIKNEKLKIEIQKSKFKEQEIENIGYVVDTWVGRAKPIQNSKFKIQNSRYIYGLSATCLLIRRNTFEEIGMFDESFHSYLEDVDLFIRLFNRGYCYAPTLDAHCSHIHMATSTRMGKYKQQQDLKNWIRIIAKNYPKSAIVRHFPSLAIERMRNISGLFKAYLKQ